MQRIDSAGYMGPSMAAGCFIYDGTTLPFAHFPRLPNNTLVPMRYLLWHVTGTEDYNGVTISHNDTD
jgi:hypothetical protein